MLPKKSCQLEDVPIQRYKRSCFASAALLHHQNAVSSHELLSWVFNWFDWKHGAWDKDPINKSERRRVSVDVKDPKLLILTVLLELSACFSSYWTSTYWCLVSWMIFSLGLGLPLLACMTHQNGSLGSHISTTGSRI